MNSEEKIEQSLTKTYTMNVQKEGNGFACPIPAAIVKYANLKDLHKCLIGPSGTDVANVLVIETKRPGSPLTTYWANLWETRVIQKRGNQASVALPTEVIDRLKEQGLIDNIAGATYDVIWNNDRKKIEITFKVGTEIDLS